MRRPPAEARARRIRHEDASAVQAFAFAAGEAAVFSRRCPGKQTPNEDTAALIPFGSTAGLLVIADGMGGGAFGDRASELCVTHLVAALAEAEGDGQLLRTAALNGIERANAAIRDLGAGAGTTVALTEIDGSSMRPYHVGDSLVLVVGQRGRVKLQTVPHSPVGFAVEAGLLDEDKALAHEDRHIVSNIVGSPDMRIEIGPTLKLAQHDTVLLASDGLADNLQSDEIVELARKGPLARAVERLAQLALERMEGAAPPSKPDDLTMIAFRRKRAPALPELP